jgi:fructose-specific component phosphotransferase system IIB-like protein
MINMNMKNIITLLAASIMLVTGCAIPQNPELVFGKKCQVSGDQVSYSWVWIQDKTMENKPSTEACEQLPKKD